MMRESEIPKTISFDNPQMNASSSEGLTLSWDVGKRGGVAFSRGALFHLLRNRLYRGEISHKRQTYPSQHKAIVSEALFEAVQVWLDDQTPRRAASGDKGYDSDAIRSDLERRGIDPVIPTKPNRKVQRAIDKTIDAMRNRIERFFNRACPRT